MRLRRVQATREQLLAELAELERRYGCATADRADAFRRDDGSVMEVSDLHRWDQLVATLWAR